MIGPEASQTTGYVVGGAGLLLVIGQMAWNKFFSTPAQAESNLYAQLNEQLQGLLARIEGLQKDMDDERRLRRLAQVRIALLELELAKHGIAIPPEGMAG